MTRESARDSQPPARAADDDANADLSITAHVTADSLRFEKVPNPRVEFTGRPERKTVWEAERENLPQEVRPGVTYRNIGITLRITSVFADIDRIVAEALGEIPAGDDAQPAPARPSPAPPERPAADGPSMAAPSAPASASSPTTPPPTSEIRDAAAAPAAQAPANTGTTNARRRPARRGRGK